MPELPEAETITRALNRTLKKRKIKKVEIFAPKLRTSFGPLCTAKLEGRAFTGCRRRARYAVADLDDGRMLVFHFGMTGTVRVDPLDVQRRKHDHAALTLDDGRVLRFNDPRRFGSVEVQCRGADGWPEGLAGIGVEPLSKDSTGEMLFAASRGRLGGQVRPEAENLRAEAVSRLRNRRCQSDARRPHELVLSQVPEVKGKV